MSIKLFVTDLDGTLLPSGQRVSAENIAAAQAAVKAGVTVTIATGRMYKAALPVAKALGVDVPIITYNGALIKTVAGEVLYSNYLEPELVCRVIDYCREREWYLQIYSQDELYYAEEKQYAQAYEADQHVKGHAVGWDGLKEHTEAVCKLLSITDSSEETDARIAELRTVFGDVLSPVRSKAQYAEIINPGVSKAAGIRKLAERLGISIADTMAIGDAENDLPMLKAAGHSVAMGNAVAAVKKVCDYETGTCQENGWAAAVFRYVLDQK